jgi:hypothetical protein
MCCGNRRWDHSRTYNGVSTNKHGEISNVGADYAQPQFGVLSQVGSVYYTTAIKHNAYPQQLQGLCGVICSGKR